LILGWCIIVDHLLCCGVPGRTVPKAINEEECHLVSSKLVGSNASGLDSKLIVGDYLLFFYGFCIFSIG